MFLMVRVDTRMIEIDKCWYCSGRRVACERQGIAAAARLLAHFFELCAKHIHISRNQVVTERNMESVPLFEFSYSFTTSICLSITCPVNRSIATCTQ